MKLCFVLLGAFLPWVRYISQGPYTPAITLSAVGASLLLAALISVTPALWRALTEELPEARQCIWLISALLYAFQLLLHWPGLISGDDINVFTALKEGHVSDWHSLSYSLIVESAYLVFGSFEHELLYNLALLLALLLFTLRLLPLSSHWILLAGVFLLFHAPPTSALAFYQNRDSLNSLLVIWLSLGLLAQSTSHRDEPWFRPATLIVLTLILSDLRQDGKLFLLLTPLSIWWVRDQSWRLLRLRTLTLMACSAVLYFLPWALYQVDSYRPAYLATTIVNPLSHVLHVKGLEVLRPDERQDLERFFRVQMLVDHYTPLEIGPLHAGGIKAEATAGDFAAFRAAARDVLARNVPLVFDNRLWVAANMLNVTGTGNLYGSAVKASKLAPWNIWHIHYLQRVFAKLPKLFRLLLMSCIFPLMAFGVFMLNFRRERALAALAALHGSRLLTVLLLAPASHFKYVTSFWVVGWLGVIFVFSPTHDRV